MRVPFVKMHGLGNDFVILDGREQELPVLPTRAIAALADRRTGIGCDQLVRLEPSRAAGTDFRMRIFNADGGEVGACGNASRAVALLHGRPARIETESGIVSAHPSKSGVEVDMGVPRFEWDSVPLAYPMDTLAMPVAWDMLENPAAVSVGNPHVVFFVDRQEDIPLEQLGPEIENDQLFPERINVNVATVTDRDSIRLRVWERGSGLTRACGTGACATAVSAIRRRLVDNEVTVHLPGGALQISWDGSGSIIMSGPAQESFRGEFDLQDYL